MDFSLEWHQAELQRTARELLGATCTVQALREAESSDPGYLTDLYARMAELGWLQVALPETDGGSGDFVDAVLLYEEFGRAALFGPHFLSTVVVPTLLAALDAERPELVRALGRGERLATIALHEPSAGYDAAAVRLRAVDAGDTLTLDGATKLFVPYAAQADVLLVAARTGEAADAVDWLEVPSDSAGLRVAPLPSISAERTYEVHFEGVRLPRSALLGRPDSGWVAWERVLPRLTVVQAAELVGLADTALGLAVEYAKQRRAFGHPIGSFQSLQHKCADMVTDRDAARYLTYAAACLVRDGQESSPAVLRAKPFAAEAARRVTKEAHQIFAGAGFVLDHKLSYYYRRAKGVDLSLADTESLLRRLEQRSALLNHAPVLRSIA